MATTTATGRSNIASVDDAVHEALSEATSDLGGESPIVGFLFASKGRDLKRALLAARRALPETGFVACSTGGELTELGLTRGGISIMLVASDEMRCNIEFSRHLRANEETASSELARRFEQTAQEA